MKTRFQYSRKQLVVAALEMSGLHEGDAAIQVQLEHGSQGPVGRPICRVSEGGNDDTLGGYPP